MIRMNCNDCELQMEDGTCYFDNDADSCTDYTPSTHKCRGCAFYSNTTKKCYFVSDDGEDYPEDYVCDDYQTPDNLYENVWRNL